MDVKYINKFTKAFICYGSDSIYSAFNNQAFDMSFKKTLAKSLVRIGILWISNVRSFFEYLKKRNCHRFCPSAVMVNMLKVVVFECQLQLCSHLGCNFQIRYRVRMPLCPLEFYFGNSHANASVVLDCQFRVNIHSNGA